MQAQRVVDQRAATDLRRRRPKDTEAQEGRRDLLEIRGVREEWEHLVRRVGQPLFDEQFVTRVGAQIFECATQRGELERITQLPRRSWLDVLAGLDYENE